MDNHIREKALNPNHSFIVEAPAGSGKTELLVQRYLSLLSTNVRQPEEILAITFTRKAAHEMRTRIIHALEKASTNNIEAMQSTTVELAKKVLLRDAKENWQLLENPNRLRIKTIDALCMYLTQQMPIISGLGGQSQMANHAEELHQQAVKNVFDTLDDETAHQQDLVAILRHFDNQYALCESVFVDMLAKRDQWLPYIIGARNTTQLQEHFETHLKHVYQEALNNVVNYFPNEILQQLIPVAQYAGFNFNDGINQDITTLLLTQDNEYRKQVDKRLGFPADAKNDNKKIMLEILQNLQDNENLKTALIQFREAPPSNYSDVSWQFLQSLLNILPLMAAELWLIFQKQKQIDFIEVSTRALQALGSDDEPTDLALVLDYQLQHILVDEFQDTSITQFQLLEKLTHHWQANDGHTLFLVGDPMQSIYRFRQANVGLFLKAKYQGIGQLKLTPLQLTQNFRSHPTLINWLNQSMPNIMPKSANITMGAVPFTPCVATKNNDDLGKLKCSVANSAQAEAQVLINQVIETRTKHPDWKIAILVRARSHLAEIIPLLKSHHLAYNALEIDPLAHQPVIQDLLVLTFALLDFNDRLAWLALLRSPMCGLSLDVLEIIANTDNRPIFEILQSINFPDDAGLRIQRLLLALTPTLNQRARMPLARWIESAWIALGAQFYTQDKDYKNCVAYYQLLTELEHEYEKLDHHIINESLSKLYTDELIADENPIHIMTIHKAKGLEFDAVFLPGLARRPAMNSQPLLRYVEQTLDNSTHWLLAPIHAKTAEQDPIYQYLARLEKHQDVYETQRLLYVALTRAKYQLYLSAVLDDNSKKPSSQSLLALLYPYVAIDYCEPTQDENMQIELVLENQRLPINWQLPNPWYHWLIDDHQPIVTENNVDESEFSPENIMKKQVGVLLHRILKYMAETGERIFKTEQAKLQLLELGVAHSKMDIALNSLSTAIDNIVCDPKGQWILQNHQDAQCEYVLHTTFNQKYKRIVIDRTFVYDNQRWIIDYKTGQESEDHSAQLNAYAHVMSQIDKHPIKLALYFPLTCTWKELA